MQTILGDYKGYCLCGIVGTLDVTSPFTLSKATVICDSLPVGSNLTVEIRKNSKTSGNVLLATLQVTTSQSPTNGRFVGTPVTSFSDASMSTGDVFYAYVSDPGSTLAAQNVRVALIY